MTGNELDSTDEAVHENNYFESSEKGSYETNYGII